MVLLNVLNVLKKQIEQQFLKTNMEIKNLRDPALTCFPALGFRSRRRDRGGPWPRSWWRSSG